MGKPVWVKFHSAGGVCLLKVQEVIDKFSSQKLMVIGDIIADAYLEGNISRISREAAGTGP